ncbi:hypothetical protein O181_031637 [Austropuccinia psidii MF-1]|uniref:Uncharacterized protein n=1 Tax=Austropuccinia psidii MF-1 TaxID=1389203 RepID=A0A9Q3H5J0_9BASI|nr:hypothetical protein [Austropuccinia psidii MF-1]
MTNATPETKLSSYKLLHQRFTANQEIENGEELLPMSSNIPNAINSQRMSCGNTNQPIIDESRSQTSTKRHKQRTCEKDKLYWKKLDNECILKRKKWDHECVNKDVQ